MQDPVEVAEARDEERLLGDEATRARMSTRKALLYDREIDERLKEALEIDETDLKAEFARTPGDIAYWHSAYADAIQVALDKEHDRKELEATLDEEYRERLRAEGDKVTDKAVAAAVAKDERLIKARREEHVAEAEKFRMRGYVEALKTKRDMLLILGGITRDELRGDAAFERM